MWAKFIINSALALAIGIMISFLNGSLVVILILGFWIPALLFLAFNIFPTLFADKDGKASLIWITLSMLDEIFAFEACTYDFFIVEGFGVFLLITTLGGGEEALETMGVDANENGFFFGISALGFDEPRIVFSLNKRAKLVSTYFLMVSVFSLSNKRTSHFEVKVVSKRSQRLLMTGIKLLLGLSLPTEWFLI